MANARDYRRRLGTMLRVEELTSAVKDYISAGYPFLLGKRRMLLKAKEHHRTPTGMVNPSPFNRTPKGSIRLNFYATFSKAQYAKQIKRVWPHSTTTWQYAVPDATMDLPIAHRGIDIERARKELGLQTIAFITDVKPFRMVFNPADEKWLSPLAVYTLSKELDLPIKVFEPQPPAVIQQSDVTDDSRAQLFLFAILSFTLDTIKLFLGFPETDGEYITFLYGQRFANVYMFIGASMGAGKFWTILAGCCFLWLTMLFDVIQIFRTVSLWLWFEFGQGKTSFIKIYKLFLLVFIRFEHYGRDAINFCATLF